MQAESNMLIKNIQLRLDRAWLLENQRPDQRAIAASMFNDIFLSQLQAGLSSVLADRHGCVTFLCTPKHCTGQFLVSKRITLVADNRMAPWRWCVTCRNKRRHSQPLISNGARQRVHAYAASLDFHPAFRWCAACSLGFKHLFVKTVEGCMCWC